VHSVADTGNQALLLLGRSRATRAQTEEHPFGFGRERYFYAFVVAVVLFTGGAAFSVFEGIHKISHPAITAPRQTWISRLLPRHLAMPAGPGRPHSGYRALITQRGDRAKAPSRLQLTWSCRGTLPRSRSTRRT